MSRDAEAARGGSCEDHHVKHIVVGTAGHIDHGKSSLVEALTGVDPDRLKEEKSRGITIDLGFARYQHGDTQLAFVDVPGHERFVRNMLAGASGIDGVLLVVAADESVMPQTREHFEICRLLEVHSGLVALTKSDLVDDETIELVRLETRELVAGSFLEGAPMIPVSARTGAGLDDLRAALRDFAAGVVGRSAHGVSRLPIDRAFTVKGFGTVVTGTQVSGHIDRDSELTLLPAGRRVKVRGVQVHGDAQASSHAGQRVAINLAGIDVDELRRGDTLTDVGGLETTERFDAVVTLLESARPLKYGARVRFHQGTTEVMARVALGAAVERGEQAGGEARFPATLEPGASAYARLHLERPAALTRGDRFVLRAYSPPLTIAGGAVLDPRPPHGRLRSSAGHQRLRRLAELDNPSAAVEIMVRETGGLGLARDVLVRRVGLARADAQGVIRTLSDGGTIVNVGDLLVSRESVRRVTDDLIAAVTSYHTAHPLDPGLSREEARERFGRRARAEVFDHVVTTLVDNGTLVGTGHLALARHRVSLSDDEARVKARLDDLFGESGLTPPDATRWAHDSGASAAVIDRMLKLLVRDGTLERLDTWSFTRRRSRV